MSFYDDDVISLDDIRRTQESLTQRHILLQNFMPNKCDMESGTMRIKDLPKWVKVYNKGMPFYDNIASYNHKHAPFRPLNKWDLEPITEATLIALMDSIETVVPHQIQYCEHMWIRGFQRVLAENTSRHITGQTNALSVHQDIDKMIVHNVEWCLAHNERTPEAHMQKNLSELMFDEEPIGVEPTTAILLSDALSGRKIKLSVVFPFKPYAVAYDKQNVYADDVIECLKRTDVQYGEYIESQLPCVVGLYNDQLACCIMSHFYLKSHGHCYDFTEYCAYVRNKSLVKAVSDFGKSLGVGLNPYLTFYVEGDSLLGRGAIPFGMHAELNKICNRNDDPNCDIVFPEGEIYSRCTELFQESMPAIAAVGEEQRWAYFSEDIDLYWRKRHVNCVNGSHHLPSNVNLGDDDASTRLEWLESVKTNCMYQTKPIIEATLSFKFENPKVRPIKSQDTLSYLNEDYIMKTIEKNWTNKSVLLNPACNSKIEEVERVQKMDGNVYVMADFTGMDMQHSMRSQNELIKARNDFLCLPDYIDEWTTMAEQNQFIRAEGVRGKLKFSMLTGRRSTTFINTVLNKVYTDIALKKNKHLVLSSFHAGDDIVLRTNDIGNADLIMRELLASKNAFNPRKQSMGPVAEFLRVAVNAKEGFGYLNRAIASTVCGSWVSKLKLAQTHLPAIYQRQAWTLDNRAMGYCGARYLLSSSMQNQTEYAFRNCFDVCGHRMIVDSGPLLIGADTATIICPQTELRLEEKEQMNNFASKDYISTAIEEAGSQFATEQLKQLVNVFTRASHLKSCLRGFDDGTIERRVQDIYPVTTHVTTKELKKVVVGALARHPTLNTLASRLSKDELILMVKLLTGREPNNYLDVQEWLEGSKAGVICTDFGITFDDTCQFAKVKLFETGQMVPTIVTSPKVYC